MLGKRKSMQYEDIDSHRGHMDHFDEMYGNMTMSKYVYPDKYEKEIFKAGKREIHFNTHVDIETITRMKKLISEIIDDNKQHLYKYDEEGNIPKGQEKEKDCVITYIVNSPGGAVHDILDFVDYINMLREKFFNLKFKSIITGLVASAGTIMCIAADIKQITRFGYAMIHELSTGVARTNYTRIQSHAEVTKKIHYDLIQIYQECRAIDPEDQEKRKKLEELLIRETWMNAKEYKEFGFVDEIIATGFPKKKKK